MPKKKEVIEDVQEVEKVGVHEVKCDECSKVVGERKFEFCDDFCENAYKDKHQ